MFGGDATTLAAPGMWAVTRSPASCAGAETLDLRSSSHITGSAQAGDSGTYSPWVGTATLPSPLWLALVPGMMPSWAQQQQLLWGRRTAGGSGYSIPIFF